jgi:hypothetical protein
MIVLAQIVIFIAALGGIIACTLACVFFAGGAMNRARTREYRTRQGVLAALSLCGLVASATAGFVAIPAIMYFAQR